MSQFADLGRLNRAPTPPMGAARDHGAVAMGIFDDAWDKLEEGWNAVKGAVEDVVDAAEEEINKVFWNWVNDALEEYFEDGGKDVDPPDSEQYESGSTKSSLQFVDPTIHAFGTVDDIVMEPDVWWANAVNGAVADAEPVADGVPAVLGFGDTFKAGGTATAVSSINAVTAPEVELPDLANTFDSAVVSENILADTLVWTNVNGSDPSVTIVELWHADLAGLSQQPAPVAAYASDHASDVEAADVWPNWDGAGSVEHASPVMWSSALF